MSNYPSVGTGLPTLNSDAAALLRHLTIASAGSGIAVQPRAMMIRLLAVC